MSAVAGSEGFEAWLGIVALDEPGRYRHGFDPRHIGNPFIRALHGGVVGSFIERAAELELERQRPGGRAELVASTVEYLRVTRDADLQGRVSVVRIARRLAFLDVWCWQDSEDAPIARGSCTLRLLSEEGAAS